MSERQRIIYVDVDDTLVRSVGTKIIPIPSIISYVRREKQSGSELYCWSTGGAAYARAVAETLDLANCFTAFLPKPNIVLDDQEVADWRTCRQVHPANCGSVDR